MLNRLVVLCALTLTLTLALAACGQRQATTAPGQALASVNGVEITVLQLNDELARAGVSAASEQAASKQLLQALIDRQLLQGEAAREKLDRDPKVMQAIERARSLIVAQAWLQQRIGTLAPPTPADIEAYYTAHPQFFSKRKQFAMEQVQLPAAALTPALKQVIDRAGALDEVTAWLAAHQVEAGRNHVTRSTADLAPALAARLLALRRGQVFAVQEGERALVIALLGVDDAPVTLATARPQIAQFLSKQQQKASASAELARLRAGATIAYLNKELAPTAVTPALGTPVAGTPVAGAAATTPASAPGAAPSGAPASAAPATDAALGRGVAGLK